MSDIGTHYVGDDCPGGHQDVQDRIDASQDAPVAEAPPQPEDDGRPSADGRRLLVRFFLPLDMRVAARALLLFSSAYPDAVLDNPDGDSTVVDIYDRPTEREDSHAK